MALTYRSRHAGSLGDLFAADAQDGNHHQPNEAVGMNRTEVARQFKAAADQNFAEGPRCCSFCLSITWKLRDQRATEIKLRRS